MEIKCSLCGSVDVNEYSVISLFEDYNSFPYNEEYMGCNICGFEFCTPEQSTNNLKRIISHIEEDINENLTIDFEELEC